MADIENLTKNIVSQRIGNPRHSVSLTAHERLQVQQLRRVFEQKGVEMCSTCGSDKAKDAGGKKVDKGLLRCGMCQRAKYCSKECQTIGWKAGHKSVCKKVE